MHAVPLALLVPYLACAAAYAALTTLILIQATRSRTGLWLASAACATSVWAGVAASGAPPEIVAAFDVARLLAWYGFCYHLYRRALGGGDRVFAVIGLAGVACGVAAVSSGHAGLGGVVSLFSPAILLRMALGIGQLLLLENIYRGAAAEQRWQVGLASCTLGLLAAYDVVVCADAVLLHAVSPTLVAGRPLVAVLVTPLLAVAAARNRQWKVDIHVSRTAAFHSATLIVSGIFLMALAVVGEFARHFGPELGVGWGGLAEVYLICAGVLTVAVLLTSGSARSALRRGVVDHFFTHRYDYRQEWQRCITTLSAQDPLPERLIRALADVVDSPAGLLYVREPGQPGMAWFGAWNTSPRGPMEEADARIVAASGPIVLAPDQLSLVLMPPAVSTDRADGPFVPWLAVPLQTQAADGAQTQELSAIGCILVARPRAPFRLDDEIVDLLRILAHEVEIHLAQDRAAASLRQTRELRDYSERFAFVAHDVKNVSSQLSLLLANAETHLADPAFQKDMLATVRSSVGRIGGLIRRLDHPGAWAAPDAGLAARSRINAAAQLAALLAARPHQGMAVLALHIDRAMPDAVEVAMEATAFQAAVTHLLDNAVTAAGCSGTVRVGLRATSSQVFIDVADDGPGMTPEFIRDELFRPFATRTEGGSGLGAFQARSLLRAAGGELAVQSAPGCGTTLRLSLPRAAVKMAQVCDLAPAEV
jgi:putative PEP-CTERM system histidine kinase